MRLAATIALLFAMGHEFASQAAVPFSSDAPSPDAQEQKLPPAKASPSSASLDSRKIDELKVGTRIKLTFADGKKCKGKILSKTPETVELKLPSRFFRSRVQTFRRSDIVTVKKLMPDWAIGVIVLGVIFVPVIAVAASGAMQQ